MELSGPQQLTHVWAASEWTLRIENQGVDGVPHSPHLLEPMGYGGAKVFFEIARGEETVRKLVSRNCFTGHSPVTAKPDVIAPGGSEELPVVLHGVMVFDLEASARDEEVDTRFVPVFETPGEHSVTAVYFWNELIVRSNPVKIDVADVPTNAKSALEGLKSLSNAGICIDVQGMYYGEWSILENVADFVEREKHTLYGAQLQIGLAEALLSIARSRGDEILPKRKSVDASLGRVKQLLAQEPPLEHGLQRSYKRLRAEFADEERKARLRAEVAEEERNSR